MAETNRKFVKANGEEEVKKTPSTKEERHENASGRRIGAIILWILAILCEVAFFFTLNKTLYFGENQLYFQLGLLAADLILVIIGSQLWKRANDIDPASKSNPTKYFLQNQMGLIVAILAFFPIIILLLTNKDLDEKSKKILTPVAAVALVLASLLSIDWHPVSEEDLIAATTKYGTEEVYYTQFGRSYHIDPDCRAIKNSKTIFVGTIEDAFAAGRNDPCDFCVPQD